MGNGFQEFAGILLVLGLFGLFLLYTLKSASMKRGILVFMTLLGSLLVIGMALSMGGPANFLLIMIPIVLLSGWLNMKRFQFCEQCGATLYNRFWFGKMQYCPKCGARLDKRE